MNAPLSKSILPHVVLFTLLSGSGAFAVSASWNGGTGNWADSNWKNGGTSSAAPGAGSGTTDTSEATFNNATAGTVTVDAYRNVKGITFDGSAGAYTLSGGNLYLTSAGTIQLGTTGSSFTGTGITETINAPITLEANYAFTNNSTDSTNVLRFGSLATITNAAASTLTLSGVNSGANTIAGNISNGTGSLNLAKRGTGTWTLTGANAITGNATIGGGGADAGILNVAGAGASLVAGGNVILGSASGDVGTLNIQNGASVGTSAKSTTIGSSAGATGTVTVTGRNAGVSSILLGTVSVGSRGNGTLNVQDGGLVDSTYIFCGRYDGSSGVITVTGINADGTRSTMNIATSVNIGRGSNAISSSATLNIQDGGSVTANTQTFNISGGGTVNVTGVNANGTASSMSSKYLSNSYDGAATLNIQDGGYVTDTNGVNLGNVSGASTTVTVTGVNANGTQSTWNSTTGASTFNVGTVSGGTGVVIIQNGGLVKIKNGTAAVTLGSVAGATGTLNIGNGGTSGTLLASGVNGGLGTASVIFNHTDDSTFSVPLTGSLSVTQFGSGKTTLSGATNTYTGTTTVSGGILAPTLATALSGYTTSGNVIFNGGTVAATMGNGTTTGWSTAQVDSLLTYATKTSGALGIDTNNADLTQWTAFTTTNFGSALGLTKLGANKLILNQANSYTGATTVSGGILRVDANNALGTTAAGTTVSNGAALYLNGVNYATAEALSINGTGISNSGALVNIGTSTYAGQVTAATDSTINTGGGNLTFTGGLVKNGTKLTLTGGGTVNVNTTAISGASAGSDLIVDHTTVNLDVANTYNGPTYIRNGGMINANVTDALPITNGRSPIIMDDSGTGASNLTLGASQSVASLTGASTSTVNLSNNTMTIGADSGTTTFAGAISGNGGSLVKDKASTQILTGASSYTGPTTVNAGTLKVDGAGTITGSVEVKSGGTLSGNGSISGPLQVSGAVNGSLGFTGNVTINSTGSMSGAHSFGGNVTLNNTAVSSVTSDIALAAGQTLRGNGGGTLGEVTAAAGSIVAPGSADALGNLTVGSFTANASSYLDLRINSVDVHDTLTTTLTSGLHLAGSLRLTVDFGYDPTNSDFLLLIDNTGEGNVFDHFNTTGGVIVTDKFGTNVSFSGNAGTLVSLNGEQFKLSYTAGVDGNDVALLAVPEPSTWAMMVGGFGMLLGVQRMRRSRTNI